MCSRIQQKKIEDNGTETVFYETMANNFPNLGKDINWSEKLSEHQMVAKPGNYAKTHPKLLKNRDKQKKSTEKEITSYPKEEK